MIALVVENHPNRALANVRHKLVRRLVHTDSTFSGVGASPNTARFSRPTPSIANDIDALAARGARQGIGEQSLSVDAGLISRFR